MWRIQLAKSTLAQIHLHYLVVGKGSCIISGQSTLVKKAIPMLPILVYHHVYPDDTPELKRLDSSHSAGIMDATGFRCQMQYIAAQGWSVISTTQAVDWLTEGTALPSKAVVLHFDNGWLDTATVVLPILRQFNFTATCFPITAGIVSATTAQSVAVRTQTEGLIEKPFMTWEQVQDLVDAGWEIGAHTATHGKLADVYAADGAAGIIREVETSNTLFKKHLGFTPSHFAYPSGSCNTSTDALLSRYYRSLRRWHVTWPIHWTFTHITSSALALECQNIDLRVAFDDFKRIFSEALAFNNLPDSDLPKT